MILLGYLANQAQFGAYSGDRALLTYPVQRLADEEDVVYVVVYDTHGRQVIKTNSRLSGQPPPNPSPVFLSEALREANKDAERLTGQPHGLLAEGAARRFWQYKNEAFNCTDLYTAIVLPDRGGPETAAFVSPTDPVTRDRVVGLVRIGMSLDPSANRLREVVRWSFLLGVGILLFGILVSVLISRRLARPIAAFSDREFANLRAT